MTTNTFEDFDSESQNLLQGMSFLDFEKIQSDKKRTYSNLELDAVQRNVSFEQIMFENKYGANASCGAFVDNWITQNIDQEKVLNFIRDNKNYSKTFYSPRFIIPTLNPANVRSPMLLMDIGLKNAVSDDIRKFTYDDVEKRIRNTGEVLIKLNSRSCFINLDEPSFQLKLDVKEEKINFNVSYIYNDALPFKDYNNLTEIENDYTIESKYNAIILETTDANSFFGLSYYFGYQEFVKKETIAVFVSALKKATSASELKFIYQNAPDFVLKEFFIEFKLEELWNHLELLTEYDDTGKLSWFKDGSEALINVLKVFGDSYYLVYKFRKDPAFLKRIYNNLDGNSIINGQVLTNKMVFASLINACVTTNKEYKDKKTILNKTFYYGNGYSIDSDITSWFSDEKDDEFFLKQRKTIVSTGTAINANDLSEEEYQSETTVDAEEGQMYHPLDMVILIDYSSGFPIPAQVPVVFVKALAEAQERQIVDRNIRIGFDILAIVLGVVALVTTANPGVFALAVADIGLATIDGGVQAYREEILKLKGGEAFLDDWERVYMAGGIALALVNAPQLVQSAFSRGTKLLTIAKTVTSANFLKTCLLKVLLELEIANFTKNTVKILEQNTEIITATSGALDKYKVGYLQEKGILLIAGDVQKTNKVSTEYGLLYKGNIVAKGDKYSFYKQIKDVARNYYKDEKLVDILDKMEDDVWRYFDKEPASGSIYETNALIDKYKYSTGFEFEKNVKYLNEKEREAYEVFVQHDKIVDVKGNLLDTNESIHRLEGEDPIISNKAIFVMSEKGKIYISKETEFGKFHHSSFLEGKPVAAAGEIIVEKGIIKLINNRSGHYKPLLKTVESNILKELDARHYFSIGTNTKQNIKFSN